MARVVVVGGGFAGMAVAARLAKLRHEVTLLERAPVLGGALAPEAEGGFSWDASATSMLLPAVVRDLFRKSGRPVERELELVPLPFLREHRFEDGSSVRVPGGSRAAQLTAFDELGPGLGQRWADHVAAYADDWEVLRRNYLEVPWDPERPAPALAAVLGSRETMRRRLRRDFRDERLRLVAGHRFVAEGHDLRDVPAWLGVHSYVEQRFGGWTVEGGMGRLTEALADRLATRRVTVHTGTLVRDLVVREGRVVAVATGDGSAEDGVDADVVVVATDPRRLPALAPYVARTTPAIPPVVCHVGLRGPLPDLGPETVLHGDPMLVVRTGGRVPEGADGSGDADGMAAWTVHGRGRLAEDVLVALARRGIDLRDRVVVRVDRSPRELVERWGGSPMGLQWQGRGTVRHRLGPTTPIAGVYAAGAHATPGGGLPFVGLSAALVAQSVGPADRRAGDPA